MSMSDSDAATNSFPADHEGLAVRSLEDVHSPIDFRLTITSRPRADQLDEGLVQQLGDFIHGGSDVEKQIPSPPDSEPFYVSKPFILYLTFLEVKTDFETKTVFTQVEFEKRDKRDPVYYPRRIKWAITIVGCCFTILVSKYYAPNRIAHPHPISHKYIVYP